MLQQRRLRCFSAGGRDVRGGEAQTLPAESPPHQPPPTTHRTLAEPSRSCYIRSFQKLQQIPESATEDTSRICYKMNEEVSRDATECSRRFCSTSNKLINVDNTYVCMHACMQQDTAAKG